MSSASMSVAVPARTLASHRRGSGNYPLCLDCQANAHEWVRCDECDRPSPHGLMIVFEDEIEPNSKPTLFCPCVPPHELAGLPEMRRAA